MTHQLAWSVLLMPTLAASAHAQGARSTLPGLAFSIDSGPGTPPPPEVVKRFGMPPELITQISGTVVFAGGRGRLDVAAVARRTPPIRIEGIVLAAPLAKAGLLATFSAGCRSVDEDVYSRVWPVGDGAPFLVQ